jgi:hypothetical protein
MNSLTHALVLGLVLGLYGGILILLRRSKKMSTVPQQLQDLNNAVAAIQAAVTTIQQRVATAITDLQDNFNKLQAILTGGGAIDPNAVEAAAQTLQSAVSSLTVLNTNLQNAVASFSDPGATAAANPSPGSGGGAASTAAPTSSATATAGGQQIVTGTSGK